MNMEKNKFLAKAVSECLDKVAYIIAACEFDEQGNISDRLLNRLFVAEDLIELVENELKQKGAI